MRDFIDRLPSGLRVSAPVLISACALGLTGYVVLMSLKSVATAVIATSVDEEGADPLAALASESDAFIETSRRRFEGRSMYALPPAPVRKPRVTEAVKPVETPKDPGPPPAPTTYTGPAPTGLIDDYVMFATLAGDIKRIRLGETVAGITVLEVNAPYNAKLGYQRGEYTVVLWGRIDERLLRGGNPASKVSGIVESGSTASISGAGSPSSANGANTPAASAGALPGSGAGGPGGLSGAPRSGAGGSGASGSSGSRAGSGLQPRPNGPNPALPAGGPGAGPDAGPPTVPGPGGELPSPAMEPQEIPPPSQSEEGQEFVDRTLLPQTLPDDRITAMSVAEAERALRAIAATDGWNVDDHSRARLDHERSLLQARVNRGG